MQIACIFFFCSVAAVDLISSSWEGKAVQVPFVPLPVRDFSATVSVRQTMLGRIGGGVLITLFTTLTGACCTHPYEKVPGFGGVFLLIAGETYNVGHMETHPRYNGHGLQEFDIGFITVNRIVSNAWIVPFASEGVHVSDKDQLQMIGFCSTYDYTCILDVSSPEYSSCHVGDEPVYRDDRAFYIMPQNTETCRIEQNDAGSPVFKNNILVGIVSRYSTPNLENAYACSRLGRVEMQVYIHQALGRIEIWLYETRLLYPPIQTPHAS